MPNITYILYFRLTFRPFVDWHIDETRFQCWSFAIDVHSSVCGKIRQFNAIQQIESQPTIDETSLRWNFRTVLFGIDVTFPLGLGFSVKRVNIDRVRIWRDNHDDSLTWPSNQRQTRKTRLDTILLVFQ